MKRSVILLIIILLLAVGGWYAYDTLNRKVQPLTDVKAEAQLSADSLIAAFGRDLASANKQYLGKVLSINGAVKAVEGEGSSVTLVLGNEASLSSVRCSMDSASAATAGTIQKGTTVTIKGACTGYNADDMGLGADVVLNRCVLQSKE